MEKRQIGNSQLFASQIGLGCMSLQNENQESEYIIHKAIEMGVTYFDTADLYDFGDNETLLGRILKEKRQNIIIATKVGNEWNDLKTGWNWNPTKQYIKQAVKGSLKRLQTDYIDLYQLHGGTIDDPIDETIEAFEELVKEGWIRYYGISSIRPNVIKEYVRRSNITSVMLQYNMLDRRPEEEMLPLLKKHNISVIARGPIAKGLLTENFLARKNEDGYLDYSYNELKQLLPRLKSLAHENHYELQEMALKYCLRNTPVAVVAPGASTIEQLSNNIAASKKPALSPELFFQLKQLLKENNYTSHR